MIRIKRSTGVSGSLFKIKIYIDGQELAKIKEGQQIELELPNEEAKIYVSQFPEHSNELIVKDGQVVEITNSTYGYFNLIFIFIAIILANFFIPFNYGIISLIVALIISTALSYFKNSFELKVIYP